jgi:hypothetical protein
MSWRQGRNVLAKKSAQGSCGTPSTFYWLTCSFPGAARVLYPQPGAAMRRHVSAQEYFGCARPGGVASCWADMFVRSFSRLKYFEAAARAEMSWRQGRICCDKTMLTQAEECKAPGELERKDAMSTTIRSSEKGQFFDQRTGDCAIHLTFPHWGPVPGRYALCNPSRGRNVSDSAARQRCLGAGAEMSRRKFQQ